VRPGGVIEIFGPLGNATFATSTCAHCQHVTTVPNPRNLHECTDICRKCMKLICLECVGKPCMPKEKWAEMQEANDRTLQRWGLK
jgi:hypothetical protein